ncbi:ABC transporter permease [Heyndrickxia sp. NPDC080065]|uniref:ABC transporter permease n=1 Tax=Heyndrickxia sp. NPDC080065 TaxID=3390568 RepID=UPI003D005599
MFWNIVRSEWLKFRKSNIWILLFISPALAALLGVLQNTDDSPVPWADLYTIMISAHSLLFLPLLTGVFSAFVCRYEHQGGGWKQLLALPVSRAQVFLAKGFLVILFLAITQLLFFICFYLIGTAKGFSGEIPNEIVWRGIIGSWIACLPLAALQLWVSTAWASFAAPLAINVIFTIPNMLVANSAKYGPWYPWAQPFLMSISKEGDIGSLYVSTETLLFVIIGSFVLFLACGFTYFRRKAV